MKDMLAEVRQSRDDWNAQVERLAPSAPIQVPSTAAPQVHSHEHEGRTPEPAALAA
jgi:hypothetical protein